MFKINEKEIDKEKINKLLKKQKNKMSKQLNSESTMPILPLKNNFNVGQALM